MRSLIRRLRAALPHPAESTDERLLDDFLAHRADDAFAEIVRRHGPMVRGVCRRVTGNAHDADDAFQATFLVLLRKADTVRPRSRLGNWLYGVAVNVARRSRDSLARRHTQELVSDVPDLANPGRESGGVEHAELRAVIDQELSGLPDAYRAAVVACDLEGHSRSEAAGRLGWSEGTVASRLARGRALLADRLTRRGVAIPAAGLLAALGPSTADAVPVVSVSLLTTGTPPAVEALATEAMRAMATSKLKTALMTACVAAGLAGAGGATAWACGVLPLVAVAPATTGKSFPLSSAEQPELKPDAGAVVEGAKPSAALAGTDKPGSEFAATAKPLQVVMSNPARDITVVSQRDERFAEFFRRQPVMVAGVPANVRDKMLFDDKGPGQVFVDYASFNADGPRVAAYGASVKLAPVPLDSPEYRLLARAPRSGAVVFVRDAADAELWHAVGFTTRPSTGFFAETKRTAPDDFAPADLLHHEPKNKK